MCISTRYTLLAFFYFTEWSVLCKMKACIVNKLVALGYQKKEAEQLYEFYLRCNKISFLEDYIDIREKSLEDENREHYVVEFEDFD